MHQSRQQRSMLLNCSLVPMPSSTRLAFVVVASLTTTGLSTGGCQALWGIEAGELVEPSGGGGSGGIAPVGGAATDGGGGGLGGGGDLGGGGMGGGLGGGAPRCVDIVGSRYAAAVLTDGPSSYFRFHESQDTSDLVDSGSQPKNATKIGDVLMTTDGVAGCALNLDGGYVVIDADVYDFAGTAHFSVEMWFQPEQGFDMPVGEPRVLVDKVKAQGVNEGWGLSLSSNNAYNLRSRRYNIDMTTMSVVGNTVPPSDAFTHVVMTFDGTNLRLYQDGVFVTMNSDGKDLGDNEEGVYFGRGNTSSYGRYRGLIDEVAIYDKQLTQNRITAHYEAGVASMQQ
jgi:Concanavalin A-like lectin/glucanases superfamily